MLQDKPIQVEFSRSFQLRYSLAVFGALVVTTGLLYLYLDRGLGEGYFHSLVTLSQLENALPVSLAVTFTVQLVLILLLSIGINLFVSHRIAGPIYRYEQSLRQITEGDLRREVRVREKDQLLGMVDALNDWQESLRRVGERGRSLQMSLQKNLAALERGEEADVAELLRQMRPLRLLLGEIDGEQGVRP